MEISHEPSRYQVYVLRLWREQAASAEHPATWRFVLEEPKTGHRRGFADFQVLMAFLEEEIVGDGFAKPTMALVESSKKPKEEETR